MIIATGIVALRGAVRLRSRETRRHLWTIDERTMSSNRITGTGRAGEFTVPICAGPAGQRKWPEFTPGRVTISARALKQNQQATGPGQGRGPRSAVRCRRRSPWMRHGAGMEDTWLLIPGQAGALKLAKYAGTETRQQAGREIALIFDKTSSRTRSAYEVAAYDQGAHVTYLDPSGSQLGRRADFIHTDVRVSMGRGQRCLGRTGPAACSLPGQRRPARETGQPRTQVPNTLALAAANSSSVRTPL